MGKSSCIYRESAVLKENDMWQECKRINPNLGKYGWPNRSPEAEKVSFKLQSDRHVTDRYVPSQDELKECNDVLKNYVRHALSQDLIQGNLEVIVKEMMLYVKRDSSPGTPYSMSCKSNGELFDQYGELIVSLVIERMHKRQQVNLEELKSKTQQQLVDEGFCDPVRVFVKSEPHKIAKLKEGRVRLIHSVSIVDKLIEMVLIRHLTKLEIANWLNIPSKPGIGFTSYDNKNLFERVTNFGVPMRSSDVEGWDWNVDQWQLEDDAEMVIELCDNPTEWWRHQIRAGAIIEGRSVYQFSDGDLVINDYFGMVNSGKYKTSSGNSRMRVKLARLVGAKFCDAAGDDAVEQEVDDAISKYARFGFKIKAYDKIENSFEFCSRIYRADKSYPLNLEKIVMNLVHNIPTTTMEYAMYLMGFENDLGEHPEYAATMSMLKEVGYLGLVGAQVIEDAEQQ